MTECAWCQDPMIGVPTGYTAPVFPCHDAAVLTREMGFRWCSEKCFREHMDSIGAGTLITAKD